MAAKPHFFFRALLVSLLLSSLLCGQQSTPFTASAATDLSVYDDALAGWDNWSWTVPPSVFNFSAASPVHTGTNSIAITFNQGWDGLSLCATNPVNTSGYTALDFWAYGGSGGTQVSLTTQTTCLGDAGAAKNLTFAAGTWTHVTIPFSDLGSPAAIARINWQERSGSAQPTFYLDEIKLLGDNQPPPTLTLSVDAAADNVPISDYIYGINLVDTNGSGDATFYAEIDLPVRRWGGNATTRYNYQYDISNHAMDWYYENVKESSATNLPADSGVNRFIDLNESVGAQSFLIMPMTGYVSKNNAAACGFSIAKYGPQQDNDSQWRPDCGNGKHTNGTFITGNDPLDTSIAIDPTFVAGWVNYLKGKYGSAANGGVRFYNTDNEPDLWFDTHRDIFPTGLTYDQWRDRTIAYAAAIKSADPTALVLGPGTGVWSYYFESPYDGQRGDWSSPDDRLAHGGVYFTPWFLQQMQAYQQAHGQRLLDYLDLHYYPQSGVALVEAGDANRQALRLRSTRSLWDPTYVDESWIAGSGPDGGIVRLIPRMQAWVDANYPGTKLAIGEYNWGGLEHINGALAQADVLGIFGREGLGLATLWSSPASTEPGAFAFRMYRNYNGSGGKFGDVRVQAASSDQAQLSIYAARRSSDQALTLMIINKTGGALNSTLALANYSPAATAQVYRYSSANLAAIQHLADQPVSAAGFSASYPANSITLIVLSPQDTFSKSAPANGATGVSLTPTLSWEASPGASGYEYCYNITGDTTCPGGWMSAGTNTSVSLAELGHGATYSWQVRTTGSPIYANGGTWWAFTTILGDERLFLPRVSR